MGKRKKTLSKDKIDFIKNNYNRFSSKELAEHLNVNASTIVKYLSQVLSKHELEERRIENTKKSLKKRTETYRFTSKDLDIISKYSGLVYGNELHKILSELGLRKMGRSKFEILLNETNFVSKKRNEDYRLFIDGNSNNFDLDNLILISKDVYNWLYHNDMLNLQGDPLLAAIKLAEYKTSFNKKRRDFNMQSRDIYGVPLEPREPKVIAMTWDNEPIYEGEYVYETPYGEYVKEEDLSRWINDTLGRPRELWREDSWQNL
ncbi:hypothetical protein CL176_02200 [Suicoccus acidiformans]|uniref:Uncharacterized protein n=1 Tax=Suicoccus acidiformans TaxID=2036206 RepID=A0A347WIM3_9LACT|nr:HTH domain-containing protein [Suicoccus acidiformans]AXY24930.1 hypothetical protein CL176_02200 [Suicoccus acidiformans]